MAAEAVREMGHLILDDVYDLIGRNEYFLQDHSENSFLVETDLIYPDGSGVSIIFSIEDDYFVLSDEGTIAILMG